MRGHIGRAKGVAGGDVGAMRRHIGRAKGVAGGGCRWHDGTKRQGQERSRVAGGGEL